MGFNIKTTFSIDKYLLLLSINVDSGMHHHRTNDLLLFLESVLVLHDCQCSLVIVLPFLLVLIFTVSCWNRCLNIKWLRTCPCSCILQPNRSLWIRCCQPTSRISKPKCSFLFHGYFLVFNRRWFFLIWLWRLYIQKITLLEILTAIYDLIYIGGLIHVLCVFLVEYRWRLLWW